MAILANELVMYKAASMNDTPTNGGLLSNAVVTTAAKNNVFPDVSQADKLAGVTNLRKVFYKVDNAANLTLQNPFVYVEKITNGDDALYIHAGTANDTQAALTGTERLYGAGTLTSAVLAGDTTCSMLLEDAAVTSFADGDLVRISNQPDVATAGTTEYLTIAVGGVSLPTGNTVTLTFTTAFANGFALGDKVAATMPLSNVAATATTPNITSAAGTFAGVANPVTLNNLATIDDTWTIAFTSATAFSVVSSTLGAVGAGNTSADTSPNNPDYGQPYFTLPFAGFGGTWVSGDTLVFTTSSASAAIWLKKIVPAGAASLTANTAVVAIEGESA